jgi:hypothetical protein
MLPKLLLVALLVNFSLVICGILVDLSNYLSFTFLPAGSGDNLSDVIIGIINQIICAFRATDQKFDYIMGATVGLIITSVMIFQFAGLLMYVLIRLVTIAVCAAVSPLAFVGMAIDAEPIKKAVEMWRDRFTQAIVNLIILSLVLYISLTIVKQMTPSIQSETGFIPLVAYAGFIIALFQMVKYVANAIGVKEIQQGYDFARKAVTGAVIAGTAAIGGAAIGGITSSAAFGNIGQQLTHVPVLNKLGYKMTDVHDKAQRDNVRNYEKSYEGRTREEVMDVANHAAPNPLNKDSYEHWVASVNVAAKHGWLNEDAANEIKAHANDPRLDIKAISTALPEYFSLVNGRLEEVNQEINQGITDTVNNLSGMSLSQLGANDHRERPILHIMERARTQGFNGLTGEAAAEAARDQFLQEYAEHARGEQLAAFFDHIDPTVFSGQDRDHQIFGTANLGGINGAVVNAIGKNTRVGQIFNAKLGSNRGLRTSLEISDEEAQSLQQKSQQQKPPGPPPPGMHTWHPMPGSPQGGFWTP